MTRRTDKLADIDRWPNLRARLVAGWSTGAALILALLYVTENADDHWDSLPLSMVLAIVGGAVLALAMVFAGMMLRWQTLPRRATLPLAQLLIAAGIGLAAFCVAATASSPRSPLGLAEPRHPAAYLAGVVLAVFGAANWPARPRS